MRKYLLLTKIAAVAISLCGGTLYSMAQGYQPTIPFTETFDDETHYTLGGDLPDGWLGCSGNDGERGFFKTEFYDNGLKAYSGDYYVSSEANTVNHRNDFLYTPDRSTPFHSTCMRPATTLDASHHLRLRLVRHRPPRRRLP